MFGIVVSPLSSFLYPYSTRPRLARSKLAKPMCCHLQKEIQFFQSRHLVNGLGSGRQIVSTLCKWGGGWMNSTFCRWNFFFFRFGTLWNGEKWETTTLCSAKLSTGSNEREPFLTLPKRLARPATLRPLDRPIDTSPMCRRATSWLPFHAPKRWNYHQNQLNFKFQILFKSY